jgi:hypothetical protein
MEELEALELPSSSDGGESPSWARAPDVAVDCLAAVVRESGLEDDEVG